MTEQREFALYMTKLMKIWLYVWVLSFGVGAIAFPILILTLEIEGERPPTIILFIIPIFALCWVYYFLSFPHKIILDSEKVQFKSIFRNKIILLKDIISIKPSNCGFGFLAVRTSHRTVRLLNQFDCFHDFVATVKDKNPNVEIRGC